MGVGICAPISANSSFDHLGLASASSFTALIDWGDGTSSASAIVRNAQTGKFEVLGTHKYRRAGTYQITIAISAADDDELALNGAITVGDRD